MLDWKKERVFCESYWGEYLACERYTEKVSPDFNERMWTMCRICPSLSMLILGFVFVVVFKVVERCIVIFVVARKAKVNRQLFNTIN